jgi:chemotaxis protein MotB
MADPQVAPIIVKKIIKGGHGHHGGAWKVAYADFVTAMMAFFLLMWLINATSPEQKKGLADYFTPTIGIKDSMGIGFQGGKMKSAQPGKSNRDAVDPGVVVGRVAQGPVNAPPAPKTESNPDAGESSNDTPTVVEKGETLDQTTDVEEFKSTEDQVKQMIEKDPEIKEYQNDIIVTQTPEGMKIDLIDDRKKPMFEKEGAVLTDAGKKILDSMAVVIAKTPNNISIHGHTDTASSVPNPQYTNWELSADRANAARRFLVTTQLEPERVLKVIGQADKELMIPQEPTNPRNRRITILVMRGSYFRDTNKDVTPTTRTLLSVPEVKRKKEEKPAETAPTGNDDGAQNNTQRDNSLFTEIGNTNPVGSANPEMAAPAGRGVLSVPDIKPMNPAATEKAPSSGEEKASPAAGGMDNR